MTQAIFKYQLEVADYQKIMMPENARILCTQSQKDHCYIWAIVDPQAAMEEREFEIYGTGHPFFENVHFGKETKYIGTFQIFNGSFVGHLFELVKL